MKRARAKSSVAAALGLLLGAVGAPLIRRRRKLAAAASPAPRRHNSEPPGAEELAALSKEELYRRARAAAIPGRSQMSKEELIAALRAARSVTAAGDPLDLRQRGKLFDRILNRLRGTVLLNWIVGWETLDAGNPSRCCSGHLARLGIADDGDVVLHLEAPSGSPAASASWDCLPLLNARNAGIGLVCELPLCDRAKFDNLSELDVCQQVRICGRWVRDRLHGHNELHPISSIEILQREFA